MKIKTGANTESQPRPEERTCGDAEQIPRREAADLLAQRRSRTVGQQADHPHLQAALRLSRRIKRLQSHSDEETQTGRAICQHLRLLLRDTQDRPQ